MQQHLGATISCEKRRGLFRTKTECQGFVSQQLETSAVNIYGNKQRYTTFVGAAASHSRGQRRYSEIAPSFPGREKREDPGNEFVEIGANNMTYNTIFAWEKLK